MKRINTEFFKKEKLTGLFKEKTQTFTNLLTKTGLTGIKDGLAQKTSGKLSERNWSQTFDMIFLPENRNKIHRYFIIISIVTLSFFTGKMIALTIRGIVGTPKDTIANTSSSFGEQSSNFRQQIKKIKDNNLFNTKSDLITKAAIQQKSKDYELDKLCSEGKSKSSSSLTLLSTIVLQNSLKSLATFEQRGQKDLVYFREGDTNSTVRVDKIERNKVIFKNLSNGTCEYIENTKVKDFKPSNSYSVVSPKQGAALMDREAPGIEQEGNIFNIKKSFRDEILGDISSILTQAKAVPISNPDGTKYFKIVNIVPGSVFTKLNIEEGDVIEAVNGKKIKTLNEVMRMLGNIKNIDHLEITKRSGGVTTTQEYNFE